MKIRIEATNRTLIPDVTVVCGPIEYSAVDGRAITNPVVVCEVLSPSTENYDQGAKLHQYRRLSSLREYVVVAQDRRFVSICRRVGDLWAFEDVETSGLVKLESLGVRGAIRRGLHHGLLGLEVDLGDLYRDGVGAIVE